MRGLPRMASPRIESVGAEPREGSAVARSSWHRPRDRWRFMSSTPDRMRHPALTSVSAASRSRVLLVGARRDARRLIRRLGKSPWNGPPIVGLRRCGSFPILELAAPEPSFRPPFPDGPRAGLGAHRSPRRAGRPRPGHARRRGRFRQVQPPLASPGDSTYQFRRRCALGLGGFRPARPRVTDRRIQRNDLVTALGHAATSPRAAVPLGPPDRGTLAQTDRRFNHCRLCPPSALSLVCPGCPGHLGDDWPADLLHSRSRGAGGRAVPDHQVSQHAVRRRKRDRTDLGIRSRHALHADR